MQTTATGQKRRFVAFGLLNLVLTNLLLQAMLALGLLTGLATFLSQFFNVLFGYYIYGSFVFRVQKPHSLFGPSALRYGLLALFLWWGNWAGIQLLVHFGWSREIAALALIIPLAAVSYGFQKWMVFVDSPRRSSHRFPCTR